MELVGRGFAEDDDDDFTIDLDYLSVESLGGVHVALGPEA
jgi:hypothetical protein